jgi:ribonuclease D
LTKNIYCTKIASKLVRTYTSRHSLLDLCEELLNIEISKEQTCTDWGASTLTEEQKLYAATDVLYLHEIKEKLDVMLEREKRMDIAQKCFNFLEARVIFDLMVNENYDIFSHS